MRAPPTDRLASWKAIAAYLDSSVRTVRRWERAEGLPVHRHMHHKLGRVFALRTELDAWRRSRSRSPPPASRLPSALLPASSWSIAVLPFASAGSDAEDDYFAGGLTEEVTIALAKVQVLQVTSRRSAAAFRTTNAGAPAIAEQLGVRYLVEGSVRRAGSRLRVSVQLIDARQDVHRWAGTYDGKMDDVFSIQEQVARKIVEALEVRLTVTEERLLGERTINNIPAYECYLRARHDMWRWHRDAIDRAVKLLRQGLALMGDNARLYATLGLAHLQYREAGIDLSDEPLLKADACASKLLALGDHSASGWQLRGWIAYSRGHIQNAVRELKIALDLDPNNSDTLLLICNCYLISGRVAAARPLLARLLAVDPLTPVTRCMPGFAEIMEGNLEAAIEPYRQMFEMDQSNPMARLFFAWVLILNGRYVAMDALLKSFPPDQRDTLPGRISFFLANAATGRPLEAQANLTPEIEAAARATDVFPRFLAEGFAFAADRESAIHWLQAAIDRGFINYPFLARHDPAFEALRSDAAFKASLETARHRWERFEV
jgi:TolB-like protein/tetratricopeptide (TPR) repeat protein